MVERLPEVLCSIIYMGRLSPGQLLPERPTTAKSNTIDWNRLSFKLIKDAEAHYRYCAELMSKIHHDEGGRQVPRLHDELNVSLHQLKPALNYRDIRLLYGILYSDIILALKFQFPNSTPDWMYPLNMRFQQDIWLELRPEDTSTIGSLREIQLSEYFDRTDTRGQLLKVACKNYDAMPDIQSDASGKIVEPPGVYDAPYTSVELSPRRAFGQTGAGVEHTNEVRLISLSGEETINYLRDEYFRFLYLLGLLQKSENHSPYLGINDEPDDETRRSLNEGLNSNFEYSWYSHPGQRSTVATKINKKSSGLVLVSKDPDSALTRYSLSTHEVTLSKT